MNKKCICGADLPSWDDDPLCPECHNKAMEAQARADREAQEAAPELFPNPITGPGIPAGDDYSVIGYEPAYVTGLEYARYHPDGRPASGFEALSILSGNAPGYTRAFVVRESYARVTGNAVIAASAAQKAGYPDASATAPGHVRLTKQRIN